MSLSASSLVAAGDAWKINKYMLLLLLLQQPKSTTMAAAVFEDSRLKE